LAGLYGTFAWKILCKLNPSKQNPQLYLIVPPRDLMFYFLPVALIYLYLELGTHVFSRFMDVDTYTFGRFILALDQEPAELLLSLGVFIFAALVWAKTPKSADPQTTERNIAPVKI
jgi:hypothetical protein